MFRCIGQGAFADVFALDGERVLKGFRDIAPSGFPEADPTVIPRVAFFAELALFERIRSHGDLELYLPRFYSTADPRDYSLDSTASYSSGCGIIMERVPGEDLKFSELPEDVLMHVERVVDAIKDATGVDHPWDGSCFVPGTRAPFTLIDIATPADRLCLVDELMSRDGRIRPESHFALGIREFYG